MWAHSEYLKLLRSAADGQVFDRISVVEERYVLERDKHPFRRYLGIFQLARPISAVVQGGALRIMDPEQFTVVYTTDNWATKTELEAQPMEMLGAFADIPVGADQTGNIVFTLYWPKQDRWLGSNFEVGVHAQPVSQGTAADKPKV